MKRFKTILAALVLPMLGHAQEIVYEYDAAGWPCTGNSLRV